MKKTFIMAGMALLLLTNSAANASDTKFNYEHNYATQNRYHGDKIGMAHFMDNGIYLGVELAFYNTKQDIALDDVVSNAYSFYTGYDHMLADNVTLTPNIETKFYSGGTSGEGYSGNIGDSGTQGARYTPGLKLTYHINDALALYAQYRYDLRKITRSKRTEADGDTHRSRYELGAILSGIGHVTVGYKVYYYDGDYIMQNNKNHDYQQDIDISYRFTENWQGNLGAEDVASSRVTDTREVKIKTGFTYTF
ncbi:oligogalacturonate-specific porin KdgM family protein [Acerihabitans sp. TG2]|uniref:oligogalacturonate-specific porin KdgM family protein n=1 Tax=Acerihabitans sp. TG2 TaxID=3096008 RepID=UPI002B22F262|nr:oligogalacturonate-specific porin KdgM family protein [Acerihabitans sp. TG2]MEA9391309.1 oligogalacturonate-specific porin KdgM family protein [Acerihabitans sp. TG2]